MTVLSVAAVGVDGQAAPGGLAQFPDGDARLDVDAPAQPLPRIFLGRPHQQRRIEPGRQAAQHPLLEPGLEQLEEGLEMRGGALPDGLVVGLADRLPPREEEARQVGLLGDPADVRRDQAVDGALGARLARRAGDQPRPVVVDAVGEQRGGDALLGAEVVIDTADRGLGWNQGPCPCGERV